jgi:tetratricopeptide (TPR) repeat protein
VAEKDSQRLRHLASAANQYAQAGQLNRATEIMEALKRKFGGTPDLQYALLSTLLDLAKVEKSDGLELAIMEQMVELRPADKSVRFSLAFKHSEVGNADMALHHYLRIPFSQRDATVWNNLGVAYGKFAMPIKAIDAFRVSEEANETLAMCNLGFELLSSGFLQEAQREADKALSVKPHHKNVPELLKRLSEVQDEEEDKLKEALEQVKAKAAFYRKLGEGILKATATKIAPSWNSPEGILEGKMDGTSVRIFGTYKRPLNALAGLLSSPSTGLIGQMTVTHRIEYSGQVRGNVILGRVKRSRDGETPSLLGSLNDDVKTAMVFNEDQTELAVMEQLGSLHPQFYTLTNSS